MKRFFVRLVLIGLIGSMARSGSCQPPSPPLAPVPTLPPAPPSPTVRRDLTPEEYRAAEATTNVHPFFALFGPSPVRPLDQAQIAGLPADSKPEVLTWERVYQLALIRTLAEPPPRFESLDPRTFAEQARRLGLDDFARFRADLVSSATFRDPATDFLDLQARFFQIEEKRWNLAFIERRDVLLRDLFQGKASGREKLDLDQSSATVVAARRELDRSIADYRDRLDLLKVALGLAPRARVTIDLTPSRLSKRSPRR